ncbi:YitT family protein [Pelistega sp. MC2]|uniref:membrane protein YczE n=1 Tax=Pelistega sp. MC2 TaxID=1720297 RepID=UPI0008DA9977|nr:hypothetical protein [Pelistega sp. MC2]
MSTRKHTLPLTTWSSNSLWKAGPKPIMVLCISLLIFGIGEGLLVLSSLGSTPWTVLAQGIAFKLDKNVGIVSFFISVAVMLTWIPFHQKPGLGTILNIALIAIGLGLTTYLLPAPNNLTLRILLTISGILFIGISSGFYLTCHMGSGPRDGLMVGLYQATGWKIGLIRSLIEGTVCFIGWLLGGVVGLGTLCFALGVGWVLQNTLNFLAKNYTSRTTH